MENNDTNFSYLITCKQLSHFGNLSIWQTFCPIKDENHSLQSTCFDAKTQKGRPVPVLAMARQSKSGRLQQFFQKSKNFDIEGFFEMAAMPFLCNSILLCCVKLP